MKSRPLGTRFDQAVLLGMLAVILSCLISLAVYETAEPVERPTIWRYDYGQNDVNPRLTPKNAQ